MIPIPNLGLYLKLAAATLILAAAAWITLTIHNLRSQAATDRTTIAALTSERDQAAEAADNNDRLLRQATERAGTAEKILADGAEAAELRGETLTIIAKEIDHAASAPTGCPAVPTRFRAVARILRDRDAATDAGQGHDGPAAGDTGSSDPLPVVTVGPRR